LAAVRKSLKIDTISRYEIRGQVAENRMVEPNDPLSVQPALASRAVVPPPAFAEPASLQRVYVLADDAAVAATLAAQLGAYGYTARVFADRAALLAAVAAEPPAVIVVDQATPDARHPGADVVGALAPGQARSIGVVFVSPRGDFNARVDAVRAGARAYVQTPLDIGELVAELDRLTRTAAPAPYRVLVVDDEAFSAEAHAAILESAGMVTTVVTDPQEVMSQLITFDADLLLLDVHMPLVAGNELAAVIRQNPTFASLPIVYLSVEQDVDKQLGAIAVGADDFLVKPVAPDRLVSSVSARAQRLRLLRGLVTQDPMTGLLNHGAFKDRLKIELGRAARSGETVVVGLIDIDHFKRVNDTYGHPAGDTVLKGLARLLKQRLRQGDVAARYGGEEFALILPRTELAAAQVIMDRLRISFAETPQSSGTAPFHVTLSCGLAAFPACPADSIVAAADQALYAAKHGGRNQVRSAQTPAPAS
jgi:diguanylate cyclase (GGDEF)-like protein